MRKMTGIKPDIKTKKSLGQNFLINPGIAPKMIAAGDIDGDFGVIELGAGRGALTGELLKTAVKVVAVELDRNLIPELSARFNNCGNLSIVHGDMQKLEFERLIESEFAPGVPVAVFGNLPYNITSPVIMKLLEEKLPVEKIVVMVQKEAALRLTAPEGSRASGAVTLAVRYYSEPHILFEVAPGSFNPIPKVSSAVIKLDVLKQPYVSVKDERYMFKLIKAAFAQRRKTAVNAINAGMSVSKEEVLKAFTKCGIDVMARAEKMTLADYSILADTLSVTAKTIGDED